MPLPPLHSAVGYAIYHLAPKEKHDWKEALGYMALANAADLDFIPGILVGKPDLFHHSFTHSFTAAIVAGLVVGFMANLGRKGTFLKTFALATLAYASHVVLDMLFDATYVPMFWPLTGAAFHSRLNEFRSNPVHFHSFDDFVCNRLLSLSCLKRAVKELVMVGIGTSLAFVSSEIKKRFSQPNPIFQKNSLPN